MQSINKCMFSLCMRVVVHLRTIEGLLKSVEWAKMHKRSCSEYGSYLQDLQADKPLLDVCYHGEH